MINAELHNVYIVLCSICRNIRILIKDMGYSWTVDVFILL